MFNAPVCFKKAFKDHCKRFPGSFLKLFYQNMQHIPLETCKIHRQIFIHSFYFLSHKVSEVHIFNACEESSL